MLRIQSNGSKWAGEAPDPLERLFERLEQYPLDRTFEAYGNFVMADPLKDAPGSVRFWGNFATVSGVFSVDTDEPDLIERLTAAIRANQQRPDYLHQPPPFESGKVEIIRHRFSETQGEVELFYDGRRLDRFGDKIELSSHGWRGHPDRYWIDAARAWLVREHEAKFADVSQ